MSISFALDLLRAWNHSLDADSAAAALFEVWFSHHLQPAVLGRLVPEPARALIPEVDTQAVVEALEMPDPGLGDAPAAARDQLLRETLSAAVAETESLLGPDPSTWSWGRLHALLFEHPLIDHLGSAHLGSDRDRLQVGPFPLGGSDLTLNKARYRPTDFAVVHGPSWRIVADVGNWDETFVVNTPGQSGDPASPHYRDLATLWAAGDYVRLPSTRVAVEREARTRILLAGGPGER